MRIESVSAVPVKPEQTDKKLKQACQDFEAIFMGFMMKSMRKTVQKSDLFGSSQEEEMFTDMMDNEVCKSASSRGSTGIADMLYRQLSRPQANTQNNSRGDTR